jgi:putative transposase
VNTDEYYLTLMRYIEQNPLRAKLVKDAKEWRWGSLYRRLQGTVKQQKLLTEWIVSEPKDYAKDINIILNKKELDGVRGSILKSSPLGGDKWRESLISKMNLEYTTRGVGRPKNGS